MDLVARGNRGCGKSVYIVVKSAGFSKFPAILPTIFLVSAFSAVSFRDCRAAETPADLKKIENAIAAQHAQLNRQQLQIEQEFLELNRQQQLLNAQLANLRGAGEPGAGQSDTSTNPSNNPSVENTGTAEAAPDDGTSIYAPPAAAQTRAQKIKVVVQSDTTLPNSGGILTPAGQFVLDPSLEYDYWSQNQLSLNGFTIIPGITFGNIFISRVQQNIATAALTARFGITDRLEVNVKVPFVFEYGTTTTQQVGPDALPLSPGAQNVNIGDVQVGASYQLNADSSTWPIFVANLLFKTTTGVSPYNVPIYIETDPDGQFLAGIQKRLPTGTGFYSLEPSLTIIYPTDPGVLFSNFQYIKNFGSEVHLPNPSGGPSTAANLQPGDAVAATFGIGFALNDTTSTTFSYQQEHVFGAFENHVAIKGSSYDFGTFNFGIGYQISARTNLNIGVGVGAGPNAPVAKILVELPMTF